MSTTATGFIENEQLAVDMRHQMENKELLKNKGSFYVGTGITASDGTSKQYTYTEAFEGYHYENQGDGRAALVEDQNKSPMWIPLSSSLGQSSTDIATVGAVLQTSTVIAGEVTFSSNQQTVGIKKEYIPGGKFSDDDILFVFPKTAEDQQRIDQNNLQFELGASTNIMGVTKPGSGLVTLSEQISINYLIIRNGNYGSNA